LKTFLLLTLITITSFAADTIINTKNCETIKLSNFTTLISCHNMDYLVEYRDVRRDDEDKVKKITLITSTENKVLVSR